MRNNIYRLRAYFQIQRIIYLLMIARYVQKAGAFKTTSVNDGRVEFAVTTGGGSIDPLNQTTAIDGHYPVSLKLGETPGKNIVVATGYLTRNGKEFSDSAIFEISGVKANIAPDQQIFINSEGYLYDDIKMNYTVEPSDYKYLPQNLSMDIFEIDSTGNKSFTGFVQVDNEGNIVLSKGTAKFNAENKYSAQIVLNRGSWEIRGDEVPLPIGQFRMVTDDSDQLPVKGAVTDGATRLRLQLFVKNNREAFAGLTWNLIDPEILDYTTADIRGAFVDGETLVDTMPVVFDANGIAEVIYRAPENFVRWGTSYETSDKDIPERVVQPTVNLQSYFKTRKDPFSPIRLKRPPVVLVHGLWGDAKAWDVFAPKFNDKGFYTVVRADYSVDGQVLSIADPAVELKFQKAIDKAIGKSRKDLFAVSKVDIVTHSMGGLVTRQYCFDYKTDCRDRIRRFVTIATPHFGSELADILLVYRSDIENGTNYFPSNPLCRTLMRRIVEGTTIPIVDWEMVEPHPIYPKGGAIDDLATGTLPPFMQANTKTYMGQWAALTPLADTMSVHTIVGIAPSGSNGKALEIRGLWWTALPACGITRDNLFGVEAERNDRIVKESSQRGNVHSGNSTTIADEDHYTVRNSNITIKGIRTLLDEPRDTSLFTK